MTRFYVKVEPGQDAFSIDCSGTYPIINLTEPAEQGRANTELVQRLSAIIGEDVGIVSGHHSRRKQLATQCPRKTVFKKLREV